MKLKQLAAALVLLVALPSAAALPSDPAPAAALPSPPVPQPEGPGMKAPEIPDIKPGDLLPDPGDLLPEVPRDLMPPLILQPCRFTDPYVMVLVVCSDLPPINVEEIDTCYYAPVLCNPGLDPCDFSPQVDNILVTCSGGSQDPGCDLPTDRYNPLCGGGLPPLDDLANPCGKAPTADRLNPACGGSIDPCQIASCNPGGGGLPCLDCGGDPAPVCTPQVERWSRVCTNDSLPPIVPPCNPQTTSVAVLLATTAECLGPGAQPLTPTIRAWASQNAECTGTVNMMHGSVSVGGKGGATVGPFAVEVGQQVTVEGDYAYAWNFKCTFTADIGASGENGFLRQVRVSLVEGQSQVDTATYVCAYDGLPSLVPASKSGCEAKSGQEHAITTGWGDNGVAVVGQKYPSTVKVCWDTQYSVQGYNEAYQALGATYTVRAPNPGCSDFGILYTWQNAVETADQYCVSLPVRPVDC